MRALIDIEQSQIEALDRLARLQRRSRAALVREAVSDYLRERNDQDKAEAFGLWSEAPVDGLALQDSLRSEW